MMTSQLCPTGANTSGTVRSLVAIILNSAAHDKDPGRSLDILYTVLDRKNYTLSASEVRFDADGSLVGNNPDLITQTLNYVF